jgi:rifampicin phosphotransferase
MDMILDWQRADEPRTVGGKAAALSGLRRAGFDVPPFFVILPEAFSGGRLCEAAADSLMQQLRELGQGPFAVRSSGREEDGAKHSHAGQFLSLLNISREAVVAAAEKVCQSGEGEAVRAYRTSKGLDAAGGAPAVVVQQMVAARTAGVAFSADPVSGRRDHIVISAIDGLGERLVSGEVDGWQYVLDRRNGSKIEGPRDQSPLSDADLEKLSALVRKVEEIRGTPQDVEWAFEDDRLFLLQARPITTALRAAPIADTTVTIFDNSNIVESYPGIVSPLTFSFAQYAYARVYRTFVQLLGVDEATIRDQGSLFENMLGRIDGRVYYNLINWYRALALLPGFALNRGYMETMMGVAEPLPEDIVRSLTPERPQGMALLREIGRVAKVAAGLGFAAVRLPRTMRAFYARVETSLRTDAAQIDMLPLTALAAEYRRMEAELLDRWDAPLVNDFLCMIAFGASRKIVQQWGGTDGVEKHNAIMIGQGDIISAEPARRIARMGKLASKDPQLIAGLAAGEAAALRSHPELTKEVDEYVAKFGDRCTEELKLESVTLMEDPQPLFDAIAAAARRSVDVLPNHSVSDEALILGHPIKNIIATKIVSIAKARVRDRENLRFERTRIFGRARRLFLAIGRQLHSMNALDDPRDVFFLTTNEVLGAIEGFGTTMDLKGLASLRRRETADHVRVPDPPERIRIDGAAIFGSPASSVALTTAAKTDGHAHSGIGCSAGVVRARARVVRDPRTDALQPGEVLVARHTDPGWIALFANASAIAVERGSLLSHSAIVARELGIPCVVGVKGATQWIKSGDQIEVDGGTGTVTLIHD